MPELPEVQALAERLTAELAGVALSRIDLIAFSGLKTFAPPPEGLYGRALRTVGRRGKFLLFDFDGPRIALHLSQSGRLDIERPPKSTRGKGYVVRLRFDADVAMLLREYGTERRAGWWVLEAGDDGPMATLGPEATSDAFVQWLRTSNDGRRIHTILRDQHTVAGIGRGYADDILHRAKVSPYGKLRAVDRAELETAIHDVLSAALDSERQRTGALSDAKLGDRFTIHNRWGKPCPVCDEIMRRVSYESHEITYCTVCQTGGKILADRRMSRLVK